MVKRGAELAAGCKMKGFENEYYENPKYQRNNIRLP
jgi:hypothetical protein